MKKIAWASTFCFRFVPMMVMGWLILGFTIATWSLNLATIEEYAKVDPLEEAKKAVNENPDIAETHMTLGAVYLEQGQNKKALEELEKAQSLGLDHYLIDIYLGKAYHKTKAYSKAKEVFQKAADFYEGEWEALQMVTLADAILALEKNKKDNKAHINLATFYYTMRNFKYAEKEIETLKKAKATESTYSKLAKNNSKALKAEELFQKGIVSFQSGDFHKATEKFVEAFGGFEALDHMLGKYEAYKMAGNCALRLGLYNDAYTYYLQANEYASQSNYANGILESLMPVTNIMFLTGEYKKAQKGYQKIIKAAQQIGNTYIEALNLCNLGNVYAAQGRFKSALTEYTNALKLNTRIGNLRGKGETYSNIGIAYFDLCDYGQALHALDQSLQVFTTLSDKFSQSILYSNKGEVCLQMGKSGDNLSLESFKKALALAKETKNDYLLVDPSINMGVYYKNHTDYEQAVSFFNEAITYAEKSTNNRQTARAYSAASSLLIELEDYQQATALLKQADTLAKTMNNIPTLIRIRSNLGWASFGLKDYKAALTSFKDAANLAKGAGLSKVLFDPYYGIARCYELTNKLDKAAEFYEIAVNAIKTSVSSLASYAGQEDIESSYLADHRQDVFEHYMDVKIALSKENEAFAILNDASNTVAATNGPKPTETIPVANNPSLTTAVENVTDNANRVTALENNLNQADNADHTKEVSDMLAAAKQELTKSLDDLKKASPTAYEHLAFPNPEQFETIQKNLTKDDTLLAYCLTDTQTVYFVITKDSYVVQKKSVRKDDLTKKVLEFRALLDIRSMTDLRANEPKMKTVLTSLYNDLIEPVSKDIKTKNLRIVPYGPLYFLPFHALIGPDKKYLIQNKSVTYFSQSAYTKLLETKPAKKTVKVLAFGNPSCNDPGFVDLPGAEEEVSIIRNIFGSINGFVRDNATKSRFLDQSDDNTIIHLAAHGVLHPRAEYSFIALSENNGLGPLRVTEIANPNTVQFSKEAILVMLSACDTAVALDINNMTGSEYVTLASGFQRQVPTVIATLWPLADASAPIVVENFYKGIKENKARDVALKDSVNILINDNRFSNPFFWAPFIMMGDWR